MERIERALARIEAAAEALDTTHADSALLQRHVRLRGQVEQAIASLDALIDSADED